MTENQRDVLFALNLLQMQGADAPYEGGIYADEVARVAGTSTRSAAVTLSQMRDFGWVESAHGSERIGWFLVGGGVAALERTRDTVPSSRNERQ